MRLLIVPPASRGVSVVLKCKNPVEQRRMCQTLADEAAAVKAMGLNKGQGKGEEDQLPVAPVVSTWGGIDRPMTGAAPLKSEREMFKQRPGFKVPSDVIPGLSNLEEEPLSVESLEE